MTALPRAVCAHCYKEAPVRRDGTMREHRRPHKIVEGRSLCAGSGKAPFKAVKS